MRAVCVIKGDFLDGTLIFNQPNKDAPVLIEGIINGLKPGFHGLTINLFGDISNGCISTGGFFNPENSNINNINHNNNNNHYHNYHFNNKNNKSNQRRSFIGDLGNIYTNENGRTIINIRDNLISLFGDPNTSIIGRSVVIHDTNDNQLNVYNGNNNNNLNLIMNGLGCGIIGIALEKSASYL